MPVIEIVLVLSAVLIGAFATLSFMSVLRRKLRALGLPLTWYNIVHLDEIELQRKERSERATDDDLLVGKELVGPKLYSEIREIVESGEMPWEDACEYVLTGGINRRRYKQRQKKAQEQSQ